MQVLLVGVLSSLLSAGASFPHPIFARTSAWIAAQDRAARPLFQQRSSQEVIAMLRNSSAAERLTAARALAASPVLLANTTVRAAVIDEMRKLTDRETARYAPPSVRTPRTEMPEKTHDEAEADLALVIAASRIEDPEVVPFLLPYVGTSASAGNRIARHGGAAIGSLVQLYDSGTGAGTPESLRFGALLTLAKIVTGGEVSTEDRQLLISLARNAFESTEAPVIIGALRLAAATGDNALMEIVKRCATDSWHPERWNPQQLSLLRTMARGLLVPGGSADSDKFTVQ